MKTEQDGKADRNAALMRDRRELLLGGATLAAASAIGASAPLGKAEAQQQPPMLTPAPGWNRALPPGPDARTKITEPYARHIARDAYFWAWPLVNMYNRRLFFQSIKDFIFAGPVPSAPLNRLAMLTDYITPSSGVSHAPTRMWSMVLGLWVSMSPLSCSRCRTSGTASGSIRLSIPERTASPLSARCTARLRVFTCWPARAGRDNRQGASIRRSALRLIARSSGHVCSWMTQRRTGGQFSRQSSRS